MSTAQHGAEMGTEVDESRDIAVIGLAGRFPGAPDLAAFWANLRGGVESITRFDEEELRAAGVSEELLKDPAHVPAWGVLDDVDLFDARHFGYSAREAALMDPQHRLFLECAWHALEDAGHAPARFDGQIGVYAGSSMSTYLIEQLLAGRGLGVSADGLEMLIANDKDYLASRVSYKLGLDGPAVCVQSACSTSLLAVHLACQALLDYDCDMALAGGATVRLPQRTGYLHQEGMILSDDGHCRPFDAKASGTVSGSGAGLVVLRRLSDALADGDRIDAVIRGSAVNNDGSQKVGYTAPGVTGQARVIAAALAAADVEPESISAIEAHGTGTRLGDPIEIAALTRVFGGLTPGSCAISSVKSNIGHLDSAAGIASLIKAVLQVRHGELVPNVNYADPNPEIDFENGPFRVVTETTPWKPECGIRRMGVSSFGFGGTNVHLVLEEPSPQPLTGTEDEVTDRPQLLPVSGSSAEATRELAGAVASALRENPGAPLVTTARTLHEGRTHLKSRAFAVAADAEGAARGLDAAAAALDPRTQAAAQPYTAWLFPGQGSQYLRMAGRVYRTAPEFRAVFDRCAGLLSAPLGADLRDLVLGPEAGDAEAAARLARTDIAQPALFTVEYALAEQLKAWGLEPDAMLGHSVGEFTAATLAGVFDLPDALRLVAARGRLMQALPAGSMLSVGLSADEVRELLDGRSGLDLAAVNGPGVSVVSGPADAVAELAAVLEDKGIGHRLLHTSHAFHSAMMEPALESFAAEVAAVGPQRPGQRYVSCLTGDWITPEEATDPWYWARQLRGTVDFAGSAGLLLEDGCTVLTEVGPGNTLTKLVRTLPGARAAAVVPLLPAAPSTASAGEAGTDDMAHLLTGVGMLWQAGAEPDWAALRGEPDAGPRPRATLPGYPFTRRRYWVDRPDGAAVAPAVQSPVLEQAEPDADGIAGVADVTDERPPNLSAPYRAPGTASEEGIVAIWEQLLGVRPVGVDDNFVELGGHSLLATKVVAAAKRALGVEIPLRRLVNAPTPADVAAIVDELASADRQAQASDEFPVAVADPAGRYEPFPLSEIQQAQWVGRLSSFSLGNVAAHMYWEVESGDLDLPRLEAAWNRLMDRHLMLRAVITPDGQQRVLEDTGPYHLAVTDLRETGEEERAAHLAELRERLSHEIRPADQWPLFDISAVLLPGGRTRLFLSFELMMADMGSVRILLRDWHALYRDPAAELPELGISFRDYRLAAAQVKDTAPYERSLAYWRERVAELPPAPDLPLAVSPEEITEPKFVPRTSVIPDAVWSTVKARAAVHGLTPSTVLLAAYACALGRWTRTGAFTLNVTSNVRLPVHEDVEQLVGGFSSFGLLPVDLRRSESVLDVAKALQEQSWQDLEYRYLNGVDVLRELARVTGDVNGAVMPAVFTSTLVNEQEHEQESMVDWLGELQHEIIQTPQVWLDAAALEVASGLCVSFPAVDALFPDGMVDELFDAYCRLLHALGDETDAAWLRRPDLLPEEHAALSARVNDTAGTVPEGLLFSGIAEWAAREPERTAVVGTDRTLTYGELYERACSLARRLRELGTGPGQLVGIALEKSAEQVVAALGVLLSGGAYLPLDVDAPEERRNHLLTHGRCRTVVTTPGAMDANWPKDVRPVAVDLGDPDARAPRPPEWVGTPDDLAYVIFTSGSTGQPKGVMISHRAALNTCVDVNERFGIGPDDRVLGLSSLSFDLSVWDIFGALGAGGSVVLPPHGANRDPGSWPALIREHGITVWNSVPALMRMLTEYLAGPGAGLDDGPLGLRVALLSGDWIPVELPDRIRAVAPGCSVISLGGATEAGIWSVFYEVTETDPEWDSVPYGTPLRNQTLHVLNDRLEPCPVWVPGDLYIGGTGLADGYWRDEERTAASFPTHPVTGRRLYRTGDLARLLPDGNLEFLGREDFQVKVGGYRIELGEIEAALASHPAVETAVAATVGDRHNRRLVAAVVPAGGPDAADRPGDDELAAAVREHAAAKLPGYMVPARVIVTEAIPLSANGKVDRTALESMGAAGAPAAAPVAAADSPTVRLLCSLAESVIGLEPGSIDPHQSFFELGGDSIAGVRTAAKAQEAGLALSLQDLFQAQSVAELAALIDARDDVVHTGDWSTVALSPGQRALLSEAGGAHEVRTYVPASLEPETVQAAMEAVSARHDALRLRLAPDRGSALLGTPAPEDLYVPLVELGGLRPHRRELALREMTRQMRDELDPVAGPLFKLTLFGLGEGDRLLVWLVHELVADARSCDQLAAELEAALDRLARGADAELPLPPAEPYARWANSMPASLATVELPPALPGGDAEAETASRVLTEEETAALLDGTHGRHRMTAEETFLAAVLAAADAPPVADLETDGRRLTARGHDVAATVGQFDTVLPGIRPERPEPGAAALLPAVKQAVRAAEEVFAERMAIGCDQPPAPASTVLVRWLGTLHGSTPRLLGGARSGYPAVVTGALVDGRLELHLTVHGGGGAERAADALVAAVRDLAAACAPEAGSGDITPDDFPLSGLDSGELDHLLHILAGEDS
ncbi:amino acid adenylation domain-containing protein [Streptomyces sp. NPDC088864]|uniref:hybrid non-ribosomal peptide synthetase/type I polyketide synthase n=1 Tax=Streptomyces sp. NPDC088864 TaxID=3365910 RepID=UPI003806B841